MYTDSNLFSFIMNPQHRKPLEQLEEKATVIACFLKRSNKHDHQHKTVPIQREQY